MRTAQLSRRSIAPRSSFAGFRFPPDVIVLAVRWYAFVSWSDGGADPNHKAPSTATTYTATFQQVK